MDSATLSTTRRYGAPALDKGLDILEHLSNEMAPLGQLEIARALGRTPGEIYRMLMCLEERGYVMREEGTGKFRLTLRLYELSHRQNSTTLLRKAARLPMEMLCESIGQACHLSVVHGANLLVLMERMPSCQVCLAVGEGSRMPALRSTSGKLLLAQWSGAAREDCLNQLEDFAGASKAERERLLKTLSELEGATHHQAPSLLTEGVTDIAVPVGVPASEVAGTLVISYLSGTKSGEKNAPRYLKALLTSAAEINRNLGIAR
ncbi:IclR family transcriptional regulator [Luteolibacter arcticus]|uniref:IclR family transcriptional regulator n=1 Tax=Luteolibacter arcticus TaxID=1581411 RepID=A0ABT3GDY0_9BACT|nr:IclR family transcriptional regulator [Luteolibacter arcticus]MCW1921219.1 IclR family transcriptional regulator [Luteolibacter arcticus]